MKRVFGVATKGLILHNRRALLIRRSGQERRKQGAWECPGGKMEFGETLESSLLREVMEETGLSVRIERLLFATSFRSSPSRQVVLLTYLCTAGGRDVRLSEEHTDYQWVTRGELLATADRSIVSDLLRFRSLDGLPLD